jgi:tripartite-type tricarboxylate transporter receptor subunit TctC
MKRLVLFVLPFVVCGFAFGSQAILAPPYPSRPIQLIIPGAAGSILDIAGGLLGEEMGRILGTPMIPVDKPGAGFTLGRILLKQSSKSRRERVCTSNSPRPPLILRGRFPSP